MAQPHTPDRRNSQPKRARKIATTCALVVVLVLCTALLIYSLLCIFIDRFYPTFGSYRLIAIVSDSMEPEIPTGDMIVTRVPESADEIQEGSVITFEVKSDAGVVLLTHRVTQVNRNEETGVVSYTTKGDNADGVDRVAPTYDDVVGVYTGRKCGFFGYVFGFIQSSEGAVALIVIALIIVLACLIIWFINTLNTWRRIAFDAIEKSKTMLAETENDESHTVADVLGIVAKDPKDRKDLKRKNKKLRLFMTTGALPKRPYSEDIDESAAQTEHLRLSEVSARQEQPEQEQSSAENTVASVNRPDTDAADKEQTAVAAEEVVEVASAVAPDITDSIREMAAAAAPTESKFERAKYEYTFRARLIQNKPESKEFYSIVKNALLSYNGVSTIDGKSCERYVVARKTVARVKLSGKTLCVMLALDPERYANKYRVFSNKSNTPAKLKITSARQARYCAELIAEMMSELGIECNAQYEPHDYYMPYEGIASLMSKGLVKRKKTETPRVAEECERMSYDMTFAARLTQLDDESKDRYSLVKNELLSYDKVRVKQGKRGETYMIGRKTVAKIDVRGKTVCLFLALDPNKYADAKYKVNALNNAKTPLKYRLSSENAARYALELIADLMAGEAAEKNAEYVPQDFRPSYENIVELMSKGLVKRKLTNKTQVFAVELVKKE